MPAYALRMRTRLGGVEVGVQVRPGSVIVTTEVGADDQTAANQLVSEVTDMASDEALLNELYGAQSSIDTGSITATQNPDAVTPPPSGPPSKSDEDHTLLAIVIILAVLVPVGAFLLYLRCESMSAIPDNSGKPYRSITTNELPSRKGGNVSFKFEM